MKAGKGDGVKKKEKTELILREIKMDKGEINAKRVSKEW